MVQLSFFIGHFYCLFEKSDYFCIRFSNKVHTILNPDVSGDRLKTVKKLVW